MNSCKRAQCAHCGAFATSLNPGHNTIITLCCEVDGLYTCGNCFYYKQNCYIFEHDDVTIYDNLKPKEHYWILDD